MVTFVAKYWLEVLFGVIVGGLSYACKKIWKLYQDEKQHKKTEEQEEFYKSIKDLVTTSNQEYQKSNEQLNQSIHQEIQTLSDELRIVKHGILNVQGKIFKNQCRDYLEEDHKVTLAEYESLEEDHAVYNSLDGNHDGDMLFIMVEEKVKKDLSE